MIFPCTRKAPSDAGIERRMLQHNIDTLETYARYLKEQPDEIQALFKELLINVTSFLSRPRGLRRVEEGNPATIVRGQAGRLCLSRLGGRLRHRRGGLFHRPLHCANI